MALADMIMTDEDALVCDLAETYGIYDYKSLPALKVATFSIGLREDSRIKIKMAGMKRPLEMTLLAAAVDRLSLLLWAKTEDGVKGINRPPSIVEILAGDVKKPEKEVMSFDTPEQFIKEWNRLTGHQSGEREVE